MSSEYGVQDDGSFDRKHIDRIVEDLKAEFKSHAGEDVELRPGSPQQQLLQAGATEISRLWMAAEDAYFASFYRDAQGAALDKKLALAGYQRKSLRPATGEVTFSRDDPAPADITIDAGTTVTTERTETRPRIPFETTEDGVLEEGTTSVSEVPIEALKPWQTDLDEEWLGEDTNVAADTVVRFDEPVSGIDSVTNPLPIGDTDEGFTEGRDRETDAEFKLRYENTLAEGGKATVDAVTATVLQFDEDILSVRVDEVRDAGAGDFGVRVTILDDNVAADEIAQAIYEARAGGVDTFGDRSGTAVKEDGGTSTENFDRATEISIMVTIDLETSDTFSSDGETSMEDRIIRYLGGVASDGLDYPGLGIGEDAIYDQVFRRIMEEQGVISADAWIGQDDPSTEQTADADDDTVVDDDAERGIRIEAQESIDADIVEARLSGNVSGPARARLLESDGTVVEAVDISDLAAGDWIRFPAPVTLATGDVLDIAVDAAGDAYDAGRDTDPSYPYDAADPPVAITQRYRGDLDNDGSPHATRPNIDAARTNGVAEADVAIADDEAARTAGADISFS